MVSSADASIKLGNNQDAKDSLTKAIAHYQSAKDTSGEAESVYKLVSVEFALGDGTASKSNLERYLALQPQGVHAAEAKELLTTRPNVY